MDDTERSALIDATDALTSAEDVIESARLLVRDVVAAETRNNGRSGLKMAGIAEILGAAEERVTAAIRCVARAMGQDAGATPAA